MKQCDNIKGPKTIVYVGSKIDLGNCFGGSKSQRQQLATHWEKPNFFEMFHLGTQSQFYMKY